MTTSLLGVDRHASRHIMLAQDHATATLYSPFGSASQTASNSSPMPGFNGQRIDTINGAFHLGNGYRAYAPSLSRFTCPDIDSPFGIGGLNPYVYCEHDPINLTDPSGHGVMRRMRKGATRVVRFFRGDSGDSMCTSLWRTLRKRRARREEPPVAPRTIRIPIEHDDENRPIAHRTNLPPADEMIFSNEFQFRGENALLVEHGYTNRFNGRSADFLTMHGTRRNTVEMPKAIRLGETPGDGPMQEFTPVQLVEYLSGRGLDLRGWGDDNAPLYLAACHIHIQPFPRELAFLLNRPVVTFGQGHDLWGGASLQDWADSVTNIFATTEELVPPTIGPRIPLVLKHLPSDFDPLNRI